MPTVNPWLIHQVLTPLVGLADSDAGTAAYCNVSGQNEASVRFVLRSIILPFFRKWLPDHQRLAKLSLQYFLNRDGFDFGRVWYRILPPFTAPTPPRLLFEWLWEELFPGESWLLSDLSSFDIDDDPEIGHRIGNVNPDEET
jgi:hypothetical protein